VTPATAVAVGKRTSVVTAKEYAAAAMASKAAEEDDMESVFIQITSSYLRFNFSPPSPPPLRHVYLRSCILSARVVNHVDEGSNTFYVIQVTCDV
jgi:hypothetical protein